MRIRSALLCLVVVAGCGRGSVVGLEENGTDNPQTPSGGDGGWIDATPPGGRDGAPPPPPPPLDGGFFPDGSRPPPPPPDAGVAMCQIDRDCYEQLGRPPCMGGDWACSAGMCALECPPPPPPPPPPLCDNDCFCPPDYACIQGECLVANRLNECCFYGCQPGGSCVDPNGGRQSCPDTPDAGVFPDAGPPPPPPPPPCLNDCDCPFSLSCINGQCFAVSSQQNQCCLNPNCPPGQMCVLPGGGSNVCGGSGETPVGDACGANGFECGPQGFCIDEGSGFPDGYCTQQCGSGFAPCPMGSACRDFGQNNDFCMDLCTSAADCRPGYNCVQLGIAPERVCWPDTGGSTNPNGHPVGGSCMQTNDCDQGLSCLSDQDGWPGGYCTIAYCDPATRPCPSGSSCFAFPGSFSLCLSNCPSGGSQSTCRMNYYCLGPTGQMGVCIN